MGNHCRQIPVLRLRNSRFQIHMVSFLLHSGQLLHAHYFRLVVTCFTCLSFGCNIFVHRKTTDVSIGLIPQQLRTSLKLSTIFLRLFSLKVYVYIDNSSNFIDSLNPVQNNNKQTL